jgi:hypothetical protein
MFNETAGGTDHSSGGFQAVFFNEPPWEAAVEKSAVAVMNQSGF